MITLREIIVDNGAFARRRFNRTIAAAVCDRV
jgi:hypothetical protein